MISTERLYYSPTRETIAMTTANHIQSNAEFRLIKNNGGLAIVDNGMSLKTYFCPCEVAEFLEDIPRSKNSRYYEAYISCSPYGINSIQFSSPLGRNEHETQKLLHSLFKRIDERFLDGDVSIMWRKNENHLPREKYVKLKNGEIKRV